MRRTHHRTYRILDVFRILTEIKNFEEGYCKKKMCIRDRRTRTWSYNGTELYRTSMQLPLSVETQITADMSMFRIGTVKTIFPSPLLLPIIITLTILFAVIMIILIVKYHIRKQNRKKKS